MFTILIASLKPNFLQSQLSWLNKQTYKDFTVIAMDVFYNENKYFKWTQKPYSFSFIHLPVIHNIQQSKRCDYSIKNNLALLAPTNHFIFLSDTAYVKDIFAESVHRSILSNKYTVFSPNIVLHNAYDSFKGTVDLNGETTAKGQACILFDKKLFFYILNGYDECLSYAYNKEFIAERFCNTHSITDLKESLIYNIHHQPEANDFGYKWKKPCDFCSNEVPYWKFANEMETGIFDVSDRFNQYTYYDRQLGLRMFECPNCGFTGCLELGKYQRMINGESIVDAPRGVIEGLGRDLVKVYEELQKVPNDIQAKVSYLKGSYYD